MWMQHVKLQLLMGKDAMKGGAGKWVGVFLLMNLRSTDMTELNASNKKWEIPRFFVQTGEKGQFLLLSLKHTAVDTSATWSTCRPWKTSSALTWTRMA